MHRSLSNNDISSPKERNTVENVKMSGTRNDDNIRVTQEV